MAHEKEALSAYLDGELKDPIRLQELERHLSDCPECRGELEELRGVSKIVSAVPRAQLPAGFLQRLERRRRADAEPAQTSLLPAPMRALAFAASSLIVMVVAYEGVREKPAMTPSSAKKDLRGFSAEGLSMSGAAAPAMGPDGHSAGAPMGERAAQAQRYDNAAQNKALEEEKAKLGVRILPRSPFALRGASGGGGGFDEDAPAETQRLQAPPAPAPVEGYTAGLLSAEQDASPMRRFGAKSEVTVPAPRAYSAAAAAKQAAPAAAAPEAEMSDAGKNAPPGLVARSPAELAALWSRHGLPGLAPRDVDFSKDMIVVLLPRGELLSVEEHGGRLVARYRLSQTSPEGRRFMMTPQSPLPVVFFPAP